MRGRGRLCGWIHAGLILMMVCGTAIKAAGQPRQGTVIGSVQDVTTGAPVEFAQILLEEANRSTISDEVGVFTLRFIPAGLFTLKAYRIGYEPLIRNVQVPAGDTLMVTLQMASTTMEVGELVVEGTREEAQQLADAALELEGQRLRQRLGTTIAETLEDEPGIAMRSMGPAPARPVLRGLGGERLLVLEDGGRTGDLSGSSTDHAVVIDPMTAERIEVVRGPAALVYGPNTLGGVVNVVRNYVPSSRPDAFHVQLSAQGQSVNNGYAGGVALSGPLGGSFAVRGDGSFRQGSDVGTPEGTLHNTDLTTANGSIGASIVESWGYAGLAASFYASGYGIPGGFVGAHPHGVDVHARRQHLESRAEILTPLSWIPRVEWRGTYSRYHHQEFEAGGSLGVEYGLLSYHGKITAQTAQYGPFRKGAIGLWAEYRDYAAGGFSSTPPSRESTMAGFAFQDVHFRGLTLQAGARYDLKRVLPRVESVSDEIGPIEARTFGGVSASVSALLHPWKELTVGITGMRSLRMPGIEELYSEGPHLAAYSFEIGNPMLDRETGYGGELFARYEGGRFSASAAAFANLIHDYIFPRETGEMNFRVYLPIYQYSGAEARMVGAEGRASLELARRWTIEGTTSYVRGTLIDLDEPIPWMPPLTGTIGLKYARRALELGADLRLASTQERLGRFEEPTDGYAVFDLFAQYHFMAGAMLHTLDLGVENVTDVAYRDHLSRVKSIMPEAGRNVKLLYRMFF